VSEPTCLRCKAKPARAGGKFCSDACAVAEASERVKGYDWCGECGVWKPYWKRCEHLVEALGFLHIGQAVGS
jgi:hypothetical protein